MGYAGIVRAQHLPAYRLAGYRVAAAADIREDRRELAKLDGIPRVYEDYRQLLERDDVDIVDCAVDHADMAARVAILKAAAKAGKAVLMQKPMATDLKTAEEMVRIAEDGGISYAVNQNLRFDPAIYLTKQFLVAGRFGKPGYIQFANLSIEGPKFGFGPEGVVMAWQIHGLDSVRWLSGGDPVSIYGTTATTPPCIRSNSPAGRSATTSSITTKIPSGARLRCAFGRRKGRCGPTTAGIQARVGRRTWWKCAATNGPRRSAGSTCKLPDDLTQREVFIRPRFDECGSIGGFIGSMGEFMQSLYEKRPALTNGRDNLMSLRMYFAGQLSAAKKRPVDPRTMEGL